MSTTDSFSPDYSSARQRFRQAASRLGWQLEDHPVGVAGPDGDQLTLDVACSPSNDAGKVLVVSSGIHGVEGFFGSAVQVGLLEQWASQSPPALKCVFLHGLNPFGFAWLRRFDENNVDPNRNFLLPGERYEGSPAGYADLDDLLNPQRPPSRWEPFTLKALWAIARYGMPALQQTVAAGQYEFPRGLFFGGAGPSRTHQLLAARFDEAVQMAEQAFTEELSKLVSHLTERLSGQEDGKPKVFRDTAVENLREFFERFRHLNIRSDEQLDALVNQAQGVVRGIQPQQLRDDQPLRQQVATQLSGVQAVLDGLLPNRCRLCRRAGCRRPG